MLILGRYTDTPDTALQRVRNRMEWALKRGVRRVWRTSGAAASGVWVTSSPTIQPPLANKHPSIRKHATMHLATDHDSAARLKLMLALYRHLGIQSQTTLGRIARDEWARAVKLAERNGVDWRAWLAERRGARAGTGTVRGSDEAPTGTTTPGDGDGDVQ